MRVAFITEDFVDNGNRLIPGGCSYYRCLLPKQATGVPSEFGRPAFVASLGFGVRIQSQDVAQFGYDTVVLKMLMHRWIPKQIEAAKNLGQRIIVDVDDHYDGLHESNHAFRATDPSLNRVANRQHYRDIILMADVVTVTTPFLQDYYRNLGANDVRLIRNGINPTQFPKRKHTSAQPVIGWAGALRWRSNDAETAAPWLGEFLTNHGLLFHHAGHMDDTKPFAEAAQVPWENMMLSTMRPIHEYQHMLNFDIGVVLLSDIEFNHAKSAIKGLEYAASNIPFVAQATPEYCRLADMGIGRVAGTPQEWQHHLTELLDYNTRKREAAQARERALKHHTVLQRAPEWNALFNEQQQPSPVATVRIPYKGI